MKQKPPYSILHDLPIPESAYEIGSQPKGGRRSIFPFRTMLDGQCAEIPLKPLLERAKHKGQIMAAIRSTIARYPERRFRTEDYIDQETHTHSMRVWRFK